MQTMSENRGKAGREKRWKREKRGNFAQWRRGCGWRQQGSHSLGKDAANRLCHFKGSPNTQQANGEKDLHRKSLLMTGTTASARLTPEGGLSCSMHKSEITDHRG